VAVDTQRQRYRRATGDFAEDGQMKKRLLITGIVVAALLLALYGVVFGTGVD
jgi:hypothetical protein